MKARARQELIGIGALAVGVFLGLTLLGTPLTGSWGSRVGHGLWQLLGAGAVLLPVLGIGWALAAFDRLGSLSGPRAAALGAGLVLLLPYGIATGGGVRLEHLRADYGAWSASQRLAGLLPGYLAAVVHGALGTAGGALVGLFALSALGLLTVGWHPLAVLRYCERGKRERGKGKRRSRPSSRSLRNRRRNGGSHPRFPFPLSRKNGSPKAHRAPDRQRCPRAH